MPYCHYRHPQKFLEESSLEKEVLFSTEKKDIYNIYYSDVLPRHIHIVWNLYHTEDCRVLYYQNAVPKMIFIEIFNASIVVDYNSHPNAFKEKQIMEISKKIV